MRLWSVDKDFCAYEEIALVEGHIVPSNIIEYYICSSLFVFRTVSNQKNSFVEHPGKVSSARNCHKLKICIDRGAVTN